MVVLGEDEELVKGWKPAGGTPRGTGEEQMVAISREKMVAESREMAMAEGSKMVCIGGVAKLIAKLMKGGAMLEGPWQ